MKLEARFLILTASILLGCFVGLAYFNGGLFFSGSSRLNDSENSYHSAFDREYTSARSLKDEIHQQLASTRTLYEFTTTSEQQKAATPAPPVSLDPDVQASAAEELAEPSQLATVEIDPEKMEEVFAEMAQNSPELTNSLNALNEARKAPADKLPQKSEPSPETMDSNSKALISVRDYSQSTPILDVNPVEDLVEFQLQGAAEAQKSLSQELLAQTQPPVPAQIPAWAQDPVPAQAPAWQPETYPAQGFDPVGAPVVAQGNAPIQTSVPILPSAPIQTCAPAATPELVQTSALVQASSPAGSPIQAPLLPAPVEGFEAVSPNQAVGSLAPLPGPAPSPLSSEDISEDLDQNPLATIAGLGSSEKAEENETANNAVENPGVAAETSAGDPAEIAMDASSEPSIKSPAVSSTENPVDSLSGSPVDSSAGSPAETSIEIPSETSAEAPAVPPKQIAENPFSHHPTRIKKPDRTPVEAQTEKEPETPIQKEEYSLDVYRVNLRKALASFQIETGLKVVASLDVQGTVSCKSKNADPEVLLASLLADTQFQFVRSGNFVYIARANQLADLPKPLNKTETQFFTPKFISLEELELVFKSNLSQFGTCEVTRDPSGEKGLSVTDWVLSLEQLEKIQQIVDVPAPEEQMNAFVFQRELDGTFKSLELLEIAEAQGLVLQRVAPLESKSKEDKKVFFPGGKNEKSSEIQAYTISYRADSFMASVRQQLRTQPAPMPGQTSAPLELNRPMTFDFNLNVQDRLVPYQITVTYRQDPQNAGGINAEVICEPREDLGTKTKANAFHFTLVIPSQGRNSLILQLDLGEFPIENAGARKDVSYAMRGNRMKKEVVAVLCPFQSVPQIPKNGLSAQAIREIIRQQEVLARKFYGSMDQGERENSKRCFAIAQRLRLGLGETGN